MRHKAFAEAKELLAQNDFRLTSEREAILKVLLDSGHQHPTAEEIYIATRQEHPGLGLATVYRTLDLFSRLGIAFKNDLGGSSSRYELNPNLKAAESPHEGHSHHHLVCRKCGKIVGFDEDLLEDIEEVITRTTGFKIVDHNLKFIGYCPECQRHSGEQPDQNLSN